ncbi:MAG TPA: hypothetical protein VGO46_03990, partial [Gemmatimonadaceae bacterium]|nr:hypothetical protein [Gemmatimonadaceae bacterium]
MRMVGFGLGAAGAATPRRVPPLGNPARFGAVGHPEVLPHPSRSATLIKPSETLIDWLLDADPSIRWQVMRDLTDTPAEIVAAERSRVALEGWGARLLGL